MQTPGATTVRGHKLALARGCSHETIAPGEEGVRRHEEGRRFARQHPRVWEHQWELAQGACVLPKAPGDPPTPGPFNDASFP